MSVASAEENDQPKVSTGRLCSWSGCLSLLQIGLPHCPAQQYWTRTLSPVPTAQGPVQQSADYDPWPTDFVPTFPAVYTSHTIENPSHSVFGTLFANLINSVSVQAFVDANEASLPSRFSLSLFPVF